MLRAKRLLKQICILVLSILILFSTFTGIPTKADEDITKEFKKEIIPLRTIEPSESLEDLMPLKEILKDKQIIGMGEATHSSSEFFKMKHRVFKFLVQEMGYRAFAIESNFGEGEIINDYILNGVGTEESALKTFAFWIWQTDEVKELIRWMREYNLNAKEKDKIRFYSFDMKFSDKEHSLLSKYLKKAKPDLEKKLIDNIIIISPSNSYSNTATSLRKNIETITSLLEDFQTYKDELIKNSSVEEYELMLKNLDIMNQASNFYRISPRDMVNVRDKCMSENVKWIVDREKSMGNDKIMLWAHNGHIANIKTDSEFMGYHLKNLYGEKYYSLCFEFYKGKFIGIDNDGLKEKELTQSTEKNLSSLFTKLDIPTFYLDSKSALKNSKIEEWSKNNTVAINSIGDRYDLRFADKYLDWINLSKNVDGLIYINEVTSAKKPVFAENKQIEKTKSPSYKLLFGVGTFLGIIVIGAVFIKRKSNKTLKQ